MENLENVANQSLAAGQRALPQKARKEKKVMMKKKHKKIVLGKNGERIKGMLASLSEAGVRDRMEMLERLTPDLANCVISQSSLPLVVDSLTTACADNNYRVCLAALRATRSLVEGAGFAQFAGVYATSLIDAGAPRLGNSKQPVRSAALDLLLALARIVPSVRFQIFMNNCSHRNWRVREQMLHFIAMIFAEHGAPKDKADREMRSCVSAIMSMQNDAREEVRKTSFDALQVLFQHTGRSFLGEYSEELISRLESARSAHGYSVSHPVPPRAPAATPGGIIPPTPMATPKSTTRRRRPKSSVKRGSTREGMKLVVDVDPVSIGSARELFREVSELQEVLGSKESIWSKRISAMQHLQGLLAGGAADLDGAESILRKLIDPLLVQLKELRSSVVRQACATVATLAKYLQGSFEAFSEILTPQLISLASVSIRVMSASAVECLKIIVASADPGKGFPRMVPRLIDGTKEKSSSTRLTSQESLLAALRSWPIDCFARFREELCYVLESALGDAVSSVRATARQTFWAFEALFHEDASRVLESLDTATQQRLYAEQDSSAGISATPIRQQRVKSTMKTTTTTTTTPGTTALNTTSGFCRRYHSHESSPKSLHLPSPSPVAAARPPGNKSHTRRTLSRTPAAKLTFHEEVNSLVRPEVADEEKPLKRSLPQLLRATRSEHWADRLASLQSLAAEFLPPRATRLRYTASAYEKICKAIAGRLPDKHQKVTHAALMLLSAMMADEDSMSPTCDNLAVLLPPLFCTVASSMSSSASARGKKNAVHELANSVLCTVRSNVDPDKLIQIVCSVADDGNTRTRLGCMEYLLHLIPTAPRALRSNENMRLALLSASDSLRSSNAQMRQVSLGVLAALYSASGRIFIAEMQGLGSSKRVAIVSALSNMVPGLHGELLGASAEQTQSARHKKENGKGKRATMTPAGGYTVPDILSLLEQRSAEARCNALQHIASIVKDVKGVAEVTQLAIASNGALRDNKPSVRRSARTAVEAMVQARPDLFASMVDVVVRNLIACCCAEETREDVANARCTLERVAMRLPPTSCAHAVIPLLSGATSSLGPRALQMAIAVISVAAQAMSSSALHEALPEVLPGLIAAMNAPTSGIRKEAVFAFVKIYISVGEAVMPYFDMMDMPLRKLVTIYIDREQRKIHGQ
eukprot:g3517.t1